MKKLLLAAVAIAIAITTAAPVKAAPENHTCRGVVTVNWTESVANGTSDNGSRLIRADNINSSCLFEANSPVGKRILAVCPMGHPCEVKGSVDSEEADVYEIRQVYSVQKIDIERK
jgi:hypothetical protein